MKNYFADNNYSIRFKSKTEAIELLYLKVFGAIPVYESSLEELKEETLESMYAKVVSVSLDCDPIPAKDRADGKLEPPWEVFARVKRERDRLAAVLQRIRDGYGGQVASPNCCEDCDYLLPIDEALAAVKENQKTDNQSCPECDVLASHGSNDGPCETHKL
jgi:hypothetical protein